MYYSVFVISRVLNIFNFEYLFCFILVRINIGIDKKNVI